MNESGSRFGESVFDDDDLNRALVVPHIILPKQFAEQGRKFTGEELLMIATLKMAVDDLTKATGYMDRSQRNDYARSALWWFRNPQWGRITLEMCCATLQLDPQTVSEKMINLAARRSDCYKREKGEHPRNGSRNGNGNAPSRTPAQGADLRELR